MQIYREQLRLDNLKSIFSNIVDHSSWKVIFGALAWFFGWLLDTRQEAVLVVGVLLVLDTMTGFAKAWKNHAVSSRGFFRFAVKFCVYFTLIITGRLVDKMLPIQFAAPIMESFLAITEAISIMENLSECGYPVPLFLVRRLSEVKDIAARAKKDPSKQNS